MSNDSGGAALNETDDRTTTDDLIVVSIWGIMLIYALFANILVQIGIFRSDRLRNSTSYWLIVSLSVCDVAMVIISLVHILPATAFHDRFVSQMDWRNIWAIFFYDLFWYTGVLKLGLMAINRFVSIVYPGSYAQVFSRSRTLWIIAGFYGLGLLVSLPTLFPCCHTVWDHKYYVTTYVPQDTKYYLVDIAVNSVSLLSMLCCYAVIINKVRSSRRALSRYRSTMKRISSSGVEGPLTVASNGNASTQYAAIMTPPRASLSRRELRLFLQFFIVSMVFLGTWVTWQWLPRISASKWIYFSMTSFFFINNGVNPTVYLIFNTTLRREVWRVLRLHKRRMQRTASGRAAESAAPGRRNKDSGESSSTSRPDRQPSPKRRAVCINGATLSTAVSSSILPAVRHLSISKEKLVGSEDSSGGPSGKARVGFSELEESSGELLKGSRDTGTDPASLEDLHRRLVDVGTDPDAALSPRLSTGLSLEDVRELERSISSEDIIVITSTV